MKDCIRIAVENSWKNTEKERLRAKMTRPDDEEQSEAYENFGTDKKKRNESCTSIKQSDA